MNIAQSLTVALMGCILSMPLMAEEIDEPANSDDVSGFSVSCGYQGVNPDKTIHHQQILSALNNATAACEAVGNTDASEWYGEKAAACAENKSYCLKPDYQGMQQSWCGHKFVHPVSETELYPARWAESMNGLIQKAKMACQKSADPVEVAAAEAYFEQLQPDTCTSNHADLPNGAVSHLPELCIMMYHDMEHHGAPY